MRMSSRLTLLVLSLMALVALAACGGDSAEPAPPTAAAEASLPTAEPTNTPIPSPTATEEPAATATLAPTEPAAEETDESDSAEETDAEPTPEAVMDLPDGWYGFGTYPDDMNPLTGEIMEDPSVLDRRPIAIKVSNYPPLVRPQRGLNNADLVFEHYAEGGATRFTAVFYGKDAHTIGSVRSARIIDFEIPVMYDAALGFSGAAGANKERFAQVEWFDQIVSPDFGHGGFYRIPMPEDVDFWHTMFTDTQRIRDILIERGIDVAPEFQNGMVFSEEPPEGGEKVEQLELGYTGNYATWWYDEGINKYMRWTDGERHIDLNTEEQLGFTNIIVVSAEHVETWIPETEVGQGANSIEIQIWGEGPVSIFRNGQRFDGTWQRNDPNDMLTFYDEDGNPIPLSPGNSWVQLVPLDFSRLYTMENS